MSSNERRRRIRALASAILMGLEAAEEDADEALLVSALIEATICYAAASGYGKGTIVTTVAKRDWPSTGEDAAKKKGS